MPRNPLATTFALLAVVGVSSLIAAPQPQVANEQRVTESTPPEVETLTGVTVDDGSNLSDTLRPTGPVTIAKGAISMIGYNDGRLTGATFVIRSPDAWAEFWKRHTGGDGDAPPVVNFRHEVVLAVVQGVQTSGGGPNVAIDAVEIDKPFVRVRVFDDERPGPLDVITNPFHIVKVPARLLPPAVSTAFEQAAPIPGTGVVFGTVMAGSLTESPDKPSPFARVTLVPTGDDSAIAKRVAYTGLDGSFFFNNVPSIRSYYLIAEARGFLPQKEIIGVPPDARVSRFITLLPAPMDGAEDDADTTAAEAVEAETVAEPIETP